MTGVELGQLFSIHGHGPESALWSLPSALLDSGTMSPGGGSAAPRVPNMLSLGKDTVPGNGDSGYGGAALL